MSDLINVFNRDGKLVVGSREVANNFGKRHNDVVDVIDKKIKNLTTKNIVVEKYFIESEFEHKGNFYKEYLLTRDGFSFIVMGFTGSKADEWKLKYIEAFNMMEETIKNNVIPANLSPELQVLINMELKQKELEIAVTETKEEIASVKESIISDVENWRDWTNQRLKAIGAALGDYKRPRAESYEELEKRAGCNLDKRLSNKKERMKKAGASKTAIDNANNLDIIGEDKKLKEIYTNIVKEMCVKYL